jgi:hypothetical protein
VACGQLGLGAESLGAEPDADMGCFSPLRQRQPKPAFTAVVETLRNAK